MFLCPWENDVTTIPLPPAQFRPVAGIHEHTAKQGSTLPARALVCGRCGRCQRCGQTISRAS